MNKQVVGRVVHTGSCLATRVCLVLALALALGGAPSPARAQEKAGNAGAGTATAQKNDAEYTAKIRAYTTEPFFLTELVDHLPASETVPTPQKVLGYPIGTPDRLTYTKDIFRYYRALAQASPRVRVWTAGQSEEGREILLVAVSDEANLAQLDRYRRITALLADPRTITDADAQRLARAGKPIYWASGSIHSPETGSPEMLMELAYRLAVEDSPFIQNIRRRLIFLITPVVEPDGRDREVDLYNYRKARPDRPAPNLVFWGKYVAHDNNRDAIGMGLALSKAMMRTFLDWHPQVLHDLHESVPFLYVSTGMGPYNAWLDPIVIGEWQKLAYNDIEEMTKRRVPGVWTHGFYDGWAPNYMSFVANGHNAIGRFYETFGGRGADTGERTVAPGATTRTWYRPNPPLPKVKWSIRNNINLQQSGLLFSLSYVAQHGEEFLNNFYLKSKRSVAKATTEGPAAWVIVNDGKRPALAAQLARLMQRQGAEVHRLDGEITVSEGRPSAGPRAGEPDTAAKSPPDAEAAAETEKPQAENAEKQDRPDASGASKKDRPDSASEEKKEARSVRLPAGSYVLRMDQPYSRIVDMLLDTQYYATSDPQPYDDTGWTLGPLRNVKTVRVTDLSILKASMTLLRGPVEAPGDIRGASDASWYVVNANAEPVLATLRFRLRELRILAAEEEFEADGARFATGSFLIPVDGNPSDARAQIEAVAAPLGIRVHATGAELKVRRHAMAVPRIALLHTWINTQDDGWFRLGLDETQVPYSYISDETVRRTPNLREKYDVILFPPATSSLAALLNGVPKRLLWDGSDFGGPIPWKNTPLTPNLVGPDATDDLRGGLGFEGLAHLKQFIEEGGVFIPITQSAHLPVDLGLTYGVSIAETRQLQARGGVYTATVEDRRSPIAYGYDESLAVYFNQGPVFRVALGRGGGGEGAGRTSGRGSATDPDVPQGRPWEQAALEPRRSRAEQEVYIEPEMREYLRGSIPPPQMWPRVVLRFAEEKALWVSGMLAGGSELAQTPAVIDVPLGRGHIVLFAANPMWRQETQGSFMLVLNAALHYDHLGLGQRDKE